jgi:hypothetical protein
MRSARRVRKSETDPVRIARRCRRR